MKNKNEKRKTSLTSVDISAIMNVCHCLNELCGKGASNFEVEELGSRYRYRMRETTSCWNGDKAGMFSVGSGKRKGIQNRECQKSATMRLLDRLTCELSQDIYFSLAHLDSVSSADFDGHESGPLFISGQPGGRVRAVAEFVYDAISLVQAIADFDRMIAIRLIKFQSFDIVNVAVDRSRSWSRHDVALTGSLLKGGARSECGKLFSCRALNDQTTHALEP
jgi:hypothetical protein